MDNNIYHQMSLGKRKYWCSNNCLHFFKRSAVPLAFRVYLKCQLTKELNKVAVDKKLALKNQTSRSSHLIITNFEGENTGVI
jgi:hypothetical protein